MPPYGTLEDLDLELELDLDLAGVALPPYGTLEDENRSATQEKLNAALSTQEDRL